jgi:hypothetical protein
MELMLPPTVSSLLGPSLSLFLVDAQLESAANNPIQIRDFV